MLSLWCRREVRILSMFLMEVIWLQNKHIVDCRIQSTTGLLWKIPQGNSNLGFKAMRYQTTRAQFYCLVDCGHECYAVGYNPDLKVNNCVVLTNLSISSTREDVWIADKGWMTFHKSGVAMQILAFRASSGTSGTTSRTYEFYSSSTASNLQQIPSAYDISEPLTNPFKHFIFEEWNKWDIKKVVLQMWKDGMPEVDITFDATQGEKMDWFKYQNLQKTSWDDLLPGGSSDIQSFSIRSNGKRSFHSQKYGGNCDDGGWTVVVDGADVCNWSQFSTYPQFLYGSLNTAIKWGETASLGKADEFILLLEVLL